MLERHAAPAPTSHNGAAAAANVPSQAKTPIPWQGSAP